MADCSNIFTFMKESERRGKSELGQPSAKGVLNGFIIASENGRKAIVEKLQEWSDAHPIQTRKEKFIKMCKENGFEKIAKILEKDGASLAYSYEFSSRKEYCEIEDEAYWNGPAE